MRKIMLFAVVLSVMATASAFAATQTWNWDFNDGTFGNWTLGGGGTGANVQTVAGSFFDSNGYGLQAHLPGVSPGTSLYMPLSTLGIGSSQSFRFEALVTMQDAARRLQACGLGVALADGDGGDSFWMEGRSTTASDLLIQRSTVGATMFTGSGNWQIPGMIKPYDGSATPAGTTMKMVISYNEPGVSDGVFRYEFYGVNFTPYQYNPAQTSSKQPQILGAAIPGAPDGLLGLGTGVWVLKAKPGTAGYYPASRIRIGGDWAKADAYFDDVKFTAYDVVVPEPGSILALCTGLVGLVGFARRRK